MIQKKFAQFLREFKPALSDQPDIRSTKKAMKKMGKKTPGAEPSQPSQPMNFGQKSLYMQQMAMLWAGVDDPGRVGMPLAMWTSSWGGIVESQSGMHVVLRRIRAGCRPEVLHVRTSDHGAHLVVVLFSSTVDEEQDKVRSMITSGANGVVANGWKCPPSCSTLSCSRASTMCFLCRLSLLCMILVHEKLVGLFISYSIRRNQSDFFMFSCSVFLLLPPRDLRVQHLLFPQIPWRK